ncbi:MAG: hypothetical protein IT378_12710 [Sandaracinaceae bacterium]|nr:hypothetical protein [Sandaracinaceae bacterium]
MADVNQFFGNGVVACAYGIDQPFVMGNAVSYGGTGYVYYDPAFLHGMTSATGSMLPAAMVLAHETGHEIQGLSSTGGSLSIARELGADCYSGYFLGYVVCQGRANMFDVMAAFDSACRAGTNLPWWDPRAHGTCDQRVAAVQQGVAAYRAGASPLAACVF